MKRIKFLLMTAAVAVLMTGVATFTACDKDDDKKEDNTEQTDKKGGSSQDGDSTANVEVKIVGTQVANIGETHATLLCRFTKADGSDFTQAEIEALMNLNPQGGFCLVEGDGLPTIKDSTINCIESARQGGVMNGTFNNLKASTTYSVRAWCTLDGSTTYGSNSTFTTTQASINIEMVTVQGGTFTMGATSEQGSDAEYDENPTHSVTLSSYQIGKYEVTQKLWKEVMGTNPSYFTGDDNRPVEQVSWNDVQEFITKLNAKTGKNYRLPTEAEWEFAARGGKQSQGYKYSGSNNLDDVAWYSDNASSTTHPVGQKSPNELGIYDMSGNVWEWCSDWYGSYSSSAQTNPTGPSSGSNRVLRGGSWYSGAKYCRVAYRDYYTPGGHYNDDGFRLAMDVE